MWVLAQIPVIPTDLMHSNPQLEEMDSERLNELESILYASIHYSDGFEEHTAMDQPAKESTSDQDARSMPPPPQQKHPIPGQRFVSGTRVINNSMQKPRYWIDGAAAVGEGQVVQAEEQQATTNKTMPGEWQPVANCIYEVIKTIS